MTKRNNAPGMSKHPDCKDECQQAVDYGVWPERSCSPECVWLKRDAASPTVAIPANPMDAWVGYATAAGLLNERGIATDPARTQTAFNAYSAAWNYVAAALVIRAASPAVVQAPEAMGSEPLTDQRIAELWYGGREPGHDVAPGYAAAFARAIEQELRAASRQCSAVLPEPPKGGA